LFLTSLECQRLPVHLSYRQFSACHGDSTDGRTATLAMTSPESACHIHFSHLQINRTGTSFGRPLMRAHKIRPTGQELDAFAPEKKIDFGRLHPCPSSTVA
jgi:hypothetical protein